MSSDYYLYFDAAPAIFKARVNMATATYPATELVFDSVTLGAFGDLIPDMTLALGTTDGASDLGLVRVHNFADSDSIPLGLISRGVERGTLNIQDNAYITVYDDYRPWAKIPKMIIDPESGEDITTFKDANIPVLSYNEEIPPVANAGPYFADYIDPITEVITVTFPMNGVDISFALAEGATITDYLWDVVDGTITVGAATDASITATFPAGRRWVGLTVTDSNGKVHTARTFVLAVDPADDVTYKDWNDLNCTLSHNGQNLQVVLNDSLPRNTYLDGCLVLLWKGGAASAGSRSHMKFSGWLVSEEWNVVSSKLGYNQGTTVTCGDLGVWLDFLPGFPQALERPSPLDDPAWEYMPDLTMQRALNYIYVWHTTGPALADLILPANSENYHAMRLDSNGSSIYDQLNTLARKMVPRAIACVTPQGQLIFQQDWMEIDVGDRPAASSILQEQDIVNVRTRYNPHPTTHVLNTGAILDAEDWIVIGGEKTLPLAFSRAPGDAFGQGTNEVVEGDGLALSQEDLNIATGHRYARLNAKYAPFDISLASIFDWWELAPAYMNRVQLNLAAEYAALRGLDFTSAFGQIQRLTIALSNDKLGIRRNVSLSWERETEGLPAATHVPEVEDDTDDDDIEVPPPIPTTPPGVTAPDLVAGIGYDGFVYRTSDFQDSSPTWERDDLSLSGFVFSWIVDPFSPGYLSGSGAINGWVATETDIYRIEDVLGATSATSIHTFATAVDESAGHWRTISASFGAYFSEGNNPWLMCVSYYGDTTDHTGTWALRSTDGGATFNAEVQVASGYGLTVPPRFNPVALWLSPRTPGLGYTVAYVSTYDGPEIAWGHWQDEITFQFFGYGASKAVHPIVSATNETLGNDQHLVIAPPPDTHRLLVECIWISEHRNEPGGGTSQGSSINRFTPASISDVYSGSYTPPAINGPQSIGGFTGEHTFNNFATHDWPVNNVTIFSSPPTDVNDGLYYEASTGASASAGTTRTVDLFMKITVLEMEMDDGTIHHPSDATIKLFRTTDWGATWTEEDTLESGEAFAGTIHVPWQGNLTEANAYYGALEDATLRQFRLKKLVSGAISDVSPTDGSINYGVNRGPFGVRTFDGAGGEQFVLAAVVGNDTESTGSGDKHAVYISDDEAATWTEVVAPIADSGAPTNRPAFEAAFGGESEQEIFIWGPPDYISYSVDFGATVLDKSGNLNSIGPCPGFVGIAGGPE